MQHSSVAIREVAVEGLFAEIQQSRLPVRLIAGKDGLVGDEQNPGTFVDVPVVGNVNQEMIGDRFGLNPAMEDRDEFVEVNV